MLSLYCCELFGFGNTDEWSWGLLQIHIINQNNNTKYGAVMKLSSNLTKRQINADFSRIFEHSRN